MALLGYQDTPGVDGFNPTQLLIGQRRTRVLKQGSLLRPKWPPRKDVGGKDAVHKWKHTDFNNTTVLETCHQSEQLSLYGPVSSVFDPLAQAKSSAPSFSSSKESASPEERQKQLESAVMELVEQSSISASKQQWKLALDQAKEAVAKERNLSRQREQAASEVPPNLDLMYCALFNLAVQYTNNQMYTEALSTYQLIVKNKAFSNAGRLKVNMGDIYFYQGNYSKAIKFFRMALDQVPNTHKDMRLKIMKNIALAFVRMGHLVDAVTSLEYIMAERADFRTALHLVVCQYHLAAGSAAVGGHDKVRRSFLKLLDVAPEQIDDKYEPSQGDPAEMLYYEEIKNDSLQQIERERRHEAEWCISTAAKLIAPVINSSFSEGYDWCLEQIKSSAYAYIANDLEISKAVAYLRKREFNQAIETLKAFEKKDTKVASTAATNLSFLYYLQNELSQADKYADHAVQADRYNAAALVNKGNCCFANNDLDRAVQYYREALTTEASCVEALYNQGLAYQKLGSLEEALDCFFKLRAIVKTIPQALYQIGRTYELQGNMDEALEWYQQLATLVPTDPNLLSKIGDIYDSQGEKQLAFQYQSDSYRYFPSNIDIIDWLGAYYIESQLYEKAIKYFEKAAIIQPSQVKWPLLVASCHNRSGNYQKALATYRSLHRRFPENVECLRFLVRLTNDLGLSESADYAAKLKKAEKAKEMKEQRTSSSGSRSGSHRSSGRLSRDGSASSSTSVQSEPAVTKARASTTSGRARAKIPLVEAEETYQASRRDIDASYEDPLGPLEERPRTAARTRNQVEDDFDNEELGDDMLPE
ncbi:LOW QUALITY PROTEIN: intraflagellar transport protein 88 homolog [Rhipicephalus sanguineus]|uniref:LOW QUALITY PROTEIN: intraflagellar transport protein 88 homolog n=1 Tax=Rhipicephalus sanguineus TaxID=34632 RepID=UPI0020C53358|nr:LOW QUALITY PROTEIN: intraflagellar transport protein 88 homolog [Rhipicephalus sanguineus]